MKNFTTTLLLAVSLSTPVLAHQYWIEPAEFFYYAKTKAMDDKVTENLTFEFSGGDVYFNADTNRTFGDDESAYQLSYVMPDGGPLIPTHSFNGETRRVIEAKATQKGTYTLAVSRTGEPMYYSKLADDRWVEKAKDELSPEESQGAKVHGGYYQHSKSYITLHEMSDSWKAPLDHALEIIPLSHPNNLYTGDDFAVQVLYQRQPLVDTKLTGIYQGYRAKQHGVKPLAVTTDSEGKATVHFDRAARWLLTVKHEEPVSDNPKMDMVEHIASLMLEVNEPWVKEWTK